MVGMFFIPLRHSKILLIQQTLADEQQKGMCTHMLEVGGGDDKEGDYGERGARRLLCHELPALF